MEKVGWIQGHKGSQALYQMEISSVLVPFRFIIAVTDAGQLGNDAGDGEHAQTAYSSGFDHSSHTEFCVPVRQRRLA